jgi:peptidyl-prolyl cis-trans isomerase SurA
MLSKTNNLKPLTKSTFLVLFLVSFFIGFSQEIIKEEEKVEVMPPFKNDKRIKADGVAAVVGDYIVLDSELSRRKSQIKANGGNIGETTDCELFGSILEEKLYAHQAIQDSIVVNELQIRSQLSQQIEQFLEETNGDIGKLLDMYDKESEEDLREEMYEINKNRFLSEEMQKKVLTDVEITPEEVRQFYNELKNSENGLPTFGTELKLANIVITPKVSEASEQKAIEKLKGFKKDVEENGASFTTKVMFYTDDLGSKSTGGKYVLNRKRPRMVKEFREVAFGLQEGQISEPFKSDFGFHIILLEKIRGQEYDVRHVLIRPEVTQEAVAEAKKLIDEVRSKIVDGSLSFADAAREFSDEKETKFEGGQVINPTTQDFNFELTKMDPEIYTQIQSLKDGEVSEVLQDEDRMNPIKFKLVTVTGRIDDHTADYAIDYLKIKRLALQDKHFDVISKWQEETIMSTYIKINGDFRDCAFTGNWLKNK